jgi:hypothetical protein
MMATNLILTRPNNAGSPLLFAKEGAVTAMERYGTADIFEICKRAGVRIDYQCWPLVTIGECEYNPPVVRVNLAALDCVAAANLGITRSRFEQSIVAHELGHLFLAELKGAVGRKVSHYANLVTAGKTEEDAHCFAVELLNLSVVEQQQMCLALRFLRETIARQMIDCHTNVALENLPRYA